MTAAIRKYIASAFIIQVSARCDSSRATPAPARCYVALLTLTFLFYPPMPGDGCLIAGRSGDGAGYSPRREIADALRLLRRDNQNRLYTAITAGASRCLMPAQATR